MNEAQTPYPIVDEMSRVIADIIKRMDLRKLGKDDRLRAASSFIAGARVLLEGDCPLSVTTQLYDVQLALLREGYARKKGGA